MSTKTKSIVDWVLAGLVAFIFVGSAYGKLAGGADGAAMAEGIGLNVESLKMIGIIEIIAVIFWMIPRTGIFGTLLLVAYMGGAIATVLEHGQSIVAPCAIAAFVWIAAVIRFPELLQRFLGKTTN
jgi:DoxX-like family